MSVLYFSDCCLPVQGVRHKMCHTLGCDYVSHFDKNSVYDCHRYDNCNASRYCAMLYGVSSYEPPLRMLQPVATLLTRNFLDLRLAKLHIQNGEGNFKQ